MSRQSMRFGTIRFRITAIAAVVVAIVLTLVAIAMVTLVRRELFTNLDNSLAQRADTYQTAFAEEDNDDLSVLLNTNDEDRAAQLVGVDGVVIASTPNLANTSPLDSIETSTEVWVRNARIADLEDDTFRLLTRDVETDSGRAVLHVAQNIDDLNDTIRNIMIALSIMVPLVVTLLVALVWWLVGRTLSPVELIRSEVDDISGTDLQRRLPVPAHADEISRLATTMNRMLDRIAAAGQRQREFVANASHELRTPLTRIRTELEVDLNQPTLADQTATQATVLEEAIAVQDLLDDLLFLARSDEQQHPQRNEQIDLDDIVYAEASHKRATSAVAIDTSGIAAAHLRGDPSQLRRVVRNLLDNAIRHAATTVSITLVENDNIIRLAVTDDGPGVPADSRDRIFERFGRTDDARTRDDGGTGLGLSIVRDITLRHGGIVSYDETWTQGARFIVELPAEQTR